jgi:6-phosphogluconate dehydrogenase (decarboxylating)
MDALVFINGSRVGYKNRLRTIPAMDIIEIKYLDSIEAGGQYGYTSGGGVFLITVE